MGSTVVTMLLLSSRFDTAVKQATVSDTPSWSAAVTVCGTVRDRALILIAAAPGCGPACPSAKGPSNLYIQALSPRLYL